MADQLNGKRVAVLATEGVEQIELLEPVKALMEAGAEVEVISPEEKRFRDIRGTRKGI
jgi:protease I